MRWILSVFLVLAFVQSPSVSLAGDCAVGIPLLNHVFFDSSDSRIPSRYNQLTPSTTSLFSLDSIKAQFDYEGYRNILNVIGYRLAAHRGWEVTLTPYSIGEEESPRVGAARAQAIRSYLVDVWRVNPTQINIVAKHPEQYRYNSQMDCGNRANWRVDLFPSNDSLLLPLWISTDTLGRGSACVTAVIIPWKLDSDYPMTSLQLLINSLNERRADGEQGRIVVHADTIKRRSSHWYYLDLKRASSLKSTLHLDSVFIDRRFSRHDECGHTIPEECLYRRAMYVELWR